MDGVGDLCYRLFGVHAHVQGYLVVPRASGVEFARDIADLVGSGVPVGGEAGVGYVMRAGYDLPPLMFTQDEIVALVAGARLIRAWGGMAMAAAAEEALVKINAVMPDGARDRAERVQVQIAGQKVEEQNVRDLFRDPHHP